ncbi:MAG: bifunctional 2',3'-cyclic-nucleotide 2'-phosphodiesterase/3'-nucleotidase [Paracoccus sp. (in: a-proteobacteria)]|uniref:bifunctional 2',3'-cyclic-nucleotide 2'-phosphodiesterase/3'-nucleotidase n=1 Tax=Paracoccus sp. TaxID=267 RepID=UPI0026DEC5D4|nr:bifunctional 2',3'-cyclic-nucleotide 2'-phosphodiesterase/3'-nucleotidase [Paracoccus sp. (in: a-proteobacteria)]MDO5631005.1 bifunctional 2',3'-cyclic-nucleotide 2'-phosphodiesterase/3'-nucleotidase [Paracoccus sp. (in: a-proteobacteria)]
MADGSSTVMIPAVTEHGTATRLSLRIMATTDLHMHVLPYNYLSDRPSNQIGLARTASLIALRRREHPNSILLDNGDFLQGSALGDFAAAIATGKTPGPHPAITAMNALGYDAATLGNHDFNYGLTFLRHAIAQATFPFTVANARFRRWSNMPRWLILNRDCTGPDGRQALLRIGIIGFLPPQTADWDDSLTGQMTCEDILTSALREVPLLRAAGADVVIALAHSGIGTVPARPMSDNVAAALAAVPGIDAIIAGHTHQVFPGPQFPALDGIDPQRGTLHGKPAVMAGYGGSHLGIIDLELSRPVVAMPWRVTGFQVRTEQVAPRTPALPEVSQPAMALHRAALRHYRRRIGRTDQPLNSFFSLIGEDRALKLVQRAQRWHVRRALRGTHWEGLPVLSAASPFRAGGRGGPSHYTNVPAGPLTLRSLADIYLFPNRIRAIALTGHDLTEWLERAAGQFRQIAPGDRDALLIDDDFPSYNFDVIDGITWDIDLSAPPRFSPVGDLLTPSGGRVRNLRYQGRPVAPDDRFVMATNSYRMAACGLYGPVAARSEVLLSERTLTRDLLRRYITHNRALNILSDRNWRFAPLPGTTALFDTSPAAMPHLPQINEQEGLRLEYLTTTDDGFARMRLFL